LGHRTYAELAARLDHLRAAPAFEGTLVLVVRRPADGRRQVLDEGTLDLEAGMVGDNWLSRLTSHAVASGRHLDVQLNVMSARMIALLADDPEQQALAGDQLYVDLDVSYDNLPTGSRLAIGDPDLGAVIEVTARPHTGCRKFVRRFGQEAVDFVNSDVGRSMRRRGFNARVVRPGVVRPGDPVRVL
jgi:MOSC domain-containing protein YiiM